MTYMRIILEISGGVTGITRTIDIDTQFLSSEDATRLEEIVSGCQLYAMPQALKVPLRGADLEHYRLTVQTKDGQHSVELEQNSVSEKVRGLIDYLKKLRKKMRRAGSGQS